MTERTRTTRTCDRCGGPCPNNPRSSLELDLALGPTIGWAWARLAGERLDLCVGCVRAFVAWWAAPQTPAVEVVRPPDLPRGAP